MVLKLTMSERELTFTLKPEPLPGVLISGTPTAILPDAEASIFDVGSDSVIIRS